MSRSSWAILIFIALSALTIEVLVKMGKIDKEVISESFSRYFGAFLFLLMLIGAHASYDDAAFYLLVSAILLFGVGRLVDKTKEKRNQSHNFLNKKD
jgi:hypothetical protein